MEMQIYTKALFLFLKKTNFDSLLEFCQILVETLMHFASVFELMTINK